MERNAAKIRLREDHSVRILATPGHFATNHSHVSYYIDLTEIKLTQSVAKRVAGRLAQNYMMSSIDTILCLEGTEMVGAFLAEALTQPGTLSLCTGLDLSVLTPEINSNGQMIFRDNTIKRVSGKRVLFLTSTISTGKTLNRMLECLNYYGGVLAGVTALFSIIPSHEGCEIHALFTGEDVPEYRSFAPSECELCRSGKKIDAIANSYGYSKL